MSHGEDNNVEIVVLSSTADAYMWDLVPVFVENSTVHTLGSASCMCAALPDDNFFIIDEVYQQSFLSVERPPAMDSNEQRLITLMDSELLQLFWAHSLDLDHQGIFFGCMILLFFSLFFGHVIFMVFCFLCWPQNVLLALFSLARCVGWCLVLLTLSCGTSCWGNLMLLLFTCTFCL